MLARNLLYTGMTRGKQLVVLLGQRKAVAVAVRGGTMRPPLDEAAALAEPGTVGQAAERPAGIQSFSERIGPVQALETGMSGRRTRRATRNGASGTGSGRSSTRGMTRESLCLRRRTPRKSVSRKAPNGAPPGATLIRCRPADAAAAPAG